MRSYAAKCAKHKGRGELKGQFMGRLSELGGLLHEEHFRIVVWLGDLKNHPFVTPRPQGGGQSFQEERQGLRHLLEGLDAFSQHDAFEEETLFPLIAEQCLPRTVNYLHREHAKINTTVAKLRSLVVSRLQKRGDATVCAQIMQAANDFYRELFDHLAREEDLIIQRLRSLLDPETDSRLVCEHFARPLFALRAVG